MTLVYLLFALFGGERYHPSLLRSDPFLAPAPRLAAGPLADPVGLTARLTHDDFRVRVAARDEFRRWAHHPAAGPFLDALGAGGDAEARDAAVRLRPALTSPKPPRPPAERLRRWKLILDRWPLPYVDSMWLDTTVTTCPHTGCVSYYAYVTGPGSTLYAMLHGPLCPDRTDQDFLSRLFWGDRFPAYRRATAHWILAWDDAGLPVEWLDPIIAVMRERDAVYLSFQTPRP